MIEFIPLKVSPDIPTYGGIKDEFSFVITFIAEGNFHAKYHASVKKLGAVQWDGTRVDLGYYERFNDAAKACEKYHRLHQQ